MLKESFFYKLFCKIYYYLKHSRIYEIISNIFYISRYSFVFRVVDKKPTVNFVYHSTSYKMTYRLLNLITRVLYNLLQKIKFIIKNSFLIDLSVSQMSLFKKLPVSTFVFYSFVFYTGYVAGLILKNQQLTIRKMAVLFVLFVLNVLNLRWKIEKYSEDSLIVNIIKKIFV